MTRPTTPTTPAWTVVSWMFSSTETSEPAPAIWAMR